MMNMNNGNSNGTMHEIKREVTRGTGIGLDLRHEVHTGGAYALFRVALVPLTFGGYGITVQNYMMVESGKRLSLSRTVYTSTATLKEAVQVVYSRFYKHVETRADGDFPELDVTAVK